MATELVHQGGVVASRGSLNIEVDTNHDGELPMHHCHKDGQETHPSRTASPKGRVELEPPRNRFQRVSPNEEA